MEQAPSTTLTPGPKIGVHFIDPQADQFIAPMYVCRRDKEGNSWVDKQDGIRVVRVTTKGPKTLRIADAKEQGIQFDPVAFATPFRKSGEIIARKTPNLDSVLSRSAQLIETNANVTARDWLALLRSLVTIMFLFRDSIWVRAISIFTGPPGSGKSTIARSIGQLLFGSGFRVTGFPSKQRDFDTALGKTPYLVLDNLEDAPRWLCDRLSTIATGGDIVQRVLYKDSQQIFLRPDVFLAITAVMPAWLRGDVLDRALIFKCALPANDRRLLDSEVQRYILQHRGNALYELLLLGTFILRGLKEADLPESRDRLVEFEHLGQAIAKAVGGDKEVARFQRGFRAARRQRFALIRDFDDELDALLSLLTSEGQVDLSALGWMEAIADHLGKNTTNEIFSRRDISGLGNWFKSLKKRSSGLVKWTRLKRTRNEPRRTRGELLERLDGLDDCDQAPDSNETEK